MIVIKLNVSLIPKERIFAGKKGKYLDLVMHENKNGTDDFGNDGFVAVSVSKEESESGVKGEIVGNWKHVGQKPKTPAPPPKKAPPKEPDPLAPDPEDDIPF